LSEKVYVKTSPQQSPHRLLLAGRRVQTETTLLDQPMEGREICITDQNGQYSSACKALLKEYYLAL
jgi:hypothetical protein